MSSQIDYKIALELKNAGFPQDNTGYCCYYIYPDRFGYLEFTGDQPREGLIRKPSLSEIIEACGDEFSGLYTTDEGYAAYTGIHSNEQEGSTPEEAVSKLWLSLNKSVDN